MFMDILLNALRYKPAFLGETYGDCCTFVFNEETDVQNLFVSQFSVDFEGTRTLWNSETFAAPQFIGFLPHTGFDNDRK